MVEIRPQPGPQEAFLACPADIAIYGGSAGGGKTYGLLMEPPRYMHDKNFYAMIFRRTSKQVHNPGGLWDTAMNMYPPLGARPLNNDKYVFRSGAYVKFDHLEHENDKLNHQGGQYALLMFDELTHFTEGQFWYVVSRNRPPDGCNVKPYVRATCNPVPEDDPVGGWVHTLIKWWIDENGFAIEERSGVLRYFTRDPVSGDIIWVDENWRDPETGDKPLSITFIRSKLEDNQKLLERDPKYKTTLLSLNKVDRERLLDGNWNASENQGMFDKSWFKFLDFEPNDIEWIRYWDRASTEPTEKNPNPDWTAGAKIGFRDGQLIIADMQHFQGSPFENERRIKRTAESDGHKISIGIELEGGSSGKDTGYNYQTKILRGFHVKMDKPTGDKIERAKPWCALAEQGHVYLVRGDWNNTFLNEANNFPWGKKDQIDAVSGGYSLLVKRGKYAVRKGKF